MFLTHTQCLLTLLATYIGSTFFEQHLQSGGVVELCRVDDRRRSGTSSTFTSAPFPNNTRANFASLNNEAFFLVSTT